MLEHAHSKRRKKEGRKAGKKERKKGWREGERIFVQLSQGRRGEVREKQRNRAVILSASLHFYTLHHCKCYHGNTVPGNPLYTLASEQIVATATYSYSYSAMAFTRGAQGCVMCLWKACLSNNKAVWLSTQACVSHSAKWPLAKSPKVQKKYAICLSSCCSCS